MLSVPDRRRRFGDVAYAPLMLIPEVFYLVAEGQVSATQYSHVDAVESSEGSVRLEQAGVKLSELVS